MDAHTHSPLPSQTKILIRVRFRLVNTKRCPLSGSSPSVSRTKPKSPSNPIRMSVAPVATNTRVAVARPNMVRPLPNSGSARQEAGSVRPRDSNLSTQSRPVFHCPTPPPPLRDRTRRGCPILFQSRQDRSPQVPAFYAVAETGSNPASSPAIPGSRSRPPASARSSRTRLPGF